MSISIFSRYFSIRFRPMEKCGVTQYFLYRDSLSSSNFDAKFIKKLSNTEAGLKNASLVKKHRF